MKFKYIFIIVLSVFMACEDPIDVTLNDADPQLVVDAWIDNQSTQLDIRLSTSLPYFTSEITPGVANATVNITRGDGQLFDFVHMGNGVYRHTLDQGETIGQVGDNFTLDIQYEGDNYTATAELNRVPQIDSITQEFRDDEVFLDDGIYCQFYGRDFDGLGDTYWIKTFKNGEYLNHPFEINIAYDAGFDSGGEVDGLVFIYPIRDLINMVDEDGIPIPYNVGDEIKVEIHSISNDAFAFLEIMRDQLLNSYNTIFAEPLANTQGNIINETGDVEALGMFNISAVSSSEYVIQ